MSLRAAIVADRPWRGVGQGVWVRRGGRVVVTADVLDSSYAISSRPPSWTGAAVFVADIEASS